MCILCFSSLLLGVFNVVVLLFVLLHNQFISSYLYMYCIVILNFEPQGMYLLKFVKKRSTKTPVVLCMNIFLFLIHTLDQLTLIGFVMLLFDIHSLSLSW